VVVILALFNCLTCQLFLLVNYCVIFRRYGISHPLNSLYKRGLCIDTNFRYAMLDNMDVMAKGCICSCDEIAFSKGYYVSLHRQKHLLSFYSRSLFL